MVTITTCTPVAQLSERETPSGTMRFKMQTRSDAPSIMVLLTDGSIAQSIAIQPSLLGYISKGIALCGNNQLWNAMEFFDMAFLYSNRDQVTIDLLLLIKVLSSLIFIQLFRLNFDMILSRQWHFPMLVAMMTQCDEFKTSP
jgi:hypothetical protein